MLYHLEFICILTCMFVKWTCQTSEHQFYNMSCCYVYASGALVLYLSLRPWIMNMPCVLQLNIHSSPVIQASQPGKQKALTDITSRAGAETAWQWQNQCYMTGTTVSTLLSVSTAVYDGRKNQQVVIVFLSFSHRFRDILNISSPPLNIDVTSCSYPVKNIF